MFSVTEVGRLFILAIPVACISWTVTHEEIFKELREYCTECIGKTESVSKRKFFYVFTCEYCFSHYISALVIIVTDFTLLYRDWRGYLIAGFALVWVANFYMGLFALLRQNVKKDTIVAKIEEKKLEK
jgi:hypothetical protein